MRRRQWPLHYMYPSQRPTVYLSRFMRIPFPCRCPSCGLDKKAADFVVA
jgi:rubredoxin